MLSAVLQMAGPGTEVLARRNMKYKFEQKVYLTFASLLMVMAATFTPPMR